MNTDYFVSYFLHNKENDGWAYQVVNKYVDLSTAKTEYHSQLASKIGVASYDVVTVMLTDSLGNVLMCESDIKEAAPEPNED